MNSRHMDVLKLDIPTSPLQKSDPAQPTHTVPDGMEKSAGTVPNPPGPPTGPAGGPPGPPGGWLFQRMSKPREILFNIMVAFLQLIPQSTLTTVFPVSGDIAESFSISNPSVMPWLVAAYALSFGTFILVGGRLGDIFGYKTMVVIGYSILSLWSVVAALSHYAGYELFFVARGFQGLGASMMVPNGLALLGRTYPPGSKQKIFSFTLFGLCAPLGAYLGMIFGALFTRFATWWWSFCTLAIVSGLLAGAASLILISPPPTPKQMLPIKDKLREMDWLGAATGVGGLICVQVSLVSAPASGWSTQYIFMLLIIGILLIAFFIIVELKIAQHPLVPFRMLKADVGFVLGAVACGWATFGIWTWFLWKFLLGVKRDSPLEAALQVLPIVPVALIASVLTAWMMRTCKPSWTLFWALTAFTLGPLLLAVDPNVDRTTYWGWTFASLVVMPFGMDMSFPAATLIMSNFFPPQQQGVAGSLISTVVNYSISLGLGLASTVEVHVNDNGRDRMAGIRGGWFMGVGLGGLGVIVCVAFVVKSILYPTPQPPKGPAGPPPGAGGPGMAMQMTPQGPVRGAEANSPAALSRATTVVPDSASPRSPKKADMEFFNTLTFDLTTPSSPNTLVSPRSRHASSTTSSSSPPSAKARGKPKDTHSHSGSESFQDLHSRTNSQTLLSAHASQPPTSPPPMPTPMALPAELDAVYRSRGSWESSDDEEQRDPWHSPHARSVQQTPRTAYGQGYATRPASRAGSRDPDGFDFDSRPAVPKGMMGERF